MNKEHGVYKIVLNDNILLTDAIGPFNQELIKHYNEELTNAIESITHDKWAQIIILHSMSMFTPQAEEEFLKTLKYRKSKGLQVVCLITKDCESSNLVKWQFEHMYSKFGISFSFVESYKDAELFIDKELNK